MADSVARIPKPEMRGLLQKSIGRNLAAAIVLAGVGAVVTKIFMGDARKKKYAEFYRTYDPDAAFERMRKAGLMSSASP